MAKKEQTFRGKTEEEIRNLSMKEFAELVPARARRAINHGFTEMQKRLLIKVKKAKEGKYKKQVKTHCRNMIIIPEMMGILIHVHSGQEFVPVEITIDKLGHYLGEFRMTRNKVQHSAPGLGATRSSKFVPLK